MRSDDGRAEAVPSVGDYLADRAVYHRLDRDLRRSAERMIRLGLVGFRPGSVLDIGCGRGVWLSEWLANGVRRVVGVDGPPHVRDTLGVPADAFVTADLARPFALGERFDLVQSLEVAQRLPASAAPGFVAALCAHGDVVLFAAAQPGQGGARHRTERPLGFWRGLFAARGYALFDPVRPLVAGDAGIERRFRFNTLVFASRDGAARMPGAWRAARVPDGEDPPSHEDLVWRLRRTALACVPGPVVSAVARGREGLVTAFARRATKD